MNPIIVWNDGINIAVPKTQIATTDRDSIILRILKMLSIALFTGCNTRANFVNGLIVIAQSAMFVKVGLYVVIRGRF